MGDDVYVHRLEYAWQQQGDFVLNGSSFEKPADRKTWHQWLAGWQNMRQRAGVHHPPSARCYLAHDGYAAIIDRAQRGADTRRDIRVSALVGRTKDLTADLALHLDPWPEAVPSNKVNRPDQEGVWSVSPANIPPRRAGRPFGGAGTRAAGPPMDFTSTTDTPGDLADQLATLIAATIEFSQQAGNGERNQLILVGADEAAARGLLVFLRDSLPKFGEDDSWPTFSTFEADFPKVAYHERDPALIFMPDFQRPPSGLSRPTAYAFLDPTLRPAEFSGPEFAARDAGASSAPLRVGRILVAARRTGQASTLAHATKIFDPDVAKWADNLQMWAEDNLPRGWRSTVVPGDPGDIPSASRPRTSSDVAPDIEARPADAEQDGVEQDGVEQPAGVEFSWAEATLRRAISADTGRPVPPHLHTVDALVDAFSARQWLSPTEGGLLRPFLRATFPGMEPLGEGPISTSQKEASKARPKSFDTLLATARRYPQGTSKAGRLTVIGELIKILAAIAPEEDSRGLERALKELSESRRPAKTPPSLKPSETSWGTAGRRPAGTAAGGRAASTNPTIDSFGDRVTKAVDIAIRRLTGQRPRAAESIPQPHWFLWVLLDAVRDSVWLSEVAVATLRTNLVRHLSLKVPQEHIPSGVTHPPTNPDHRTVEAVHRVVADILRDKDAQVAALGATDYRGAAELLVDTISVISKEAVGGAAVEKREDSIKALQNTVATFLSAQAGPAEVARRKAHDRLWDLVRRATDISSGSFSDKSTGIAVLNLAAIPAAAVWIPRDEVVHYIDAVWRTLAGMGIERPRIPTAWWLYETTPQDRGQDDAVLDLEAVQWEVRRSLGKIHAELHQTGGPGFSVRDVADLLARRLRKVAVSLGDFGVAEDSTIDKLCDAVNTHIRVWEEEHSQVKMTTAVDAAAMRWREQQERTEADLKDVRARLHQRGHDTQHAERLQAHVGELEERLKKQKNEVQRARLITTVAAEVQDIPRGGDVTVEISDWLTEKLSPVVDLDTSRVVDALSEYRTRRQADPAVDARPPRDGADARKAVMAWTRRLQETPPGTPEDAVGLLARLDRPPFSEIDPGSTEIRAFKKAAAAHVERHHEAPAPPTGSMWLKNAADFLKEAADFVGRAWAIPALVAFCLACALIVGLTS